MFFIILKELYLITLRIIKILESWVVKHLKYIHTEESMNAIIDIYDLTEKYLGWSLGWSLGTDLEKNWLIVLKLDIRSM